MGQREETDGKSPGLDDGVEVLNEKIKLYGFTSGLLDPRDNNFVLKFKHIVLGFILHTNQIVPSDKILGNKISVPFPGTYTIPLFLYYSLFMYFQKFEDT